MVRILLLLLLLLLSPMVNAKENIRTDPAEVQRLAEMYLKKVILSEI